MRLWLVLLACLAPVVAAGHAATPRPGTAEVAVRMTPEGVRASFVLDRAVSRFAFAEVDSVREGDFELLTPGLTLSEEAVTGPRPFRRFDLLIRPMRQERDAKYPAYFRIGEGGVVYAPALLGDRKAWRTRISFLTAPGQVRAPRGSAERGFVFIGPRALLTEDKHIQVVADPATPAWLVERTRTDLAAAVRAFTRSLGMSPPRKPLLIVKHQAGTRDFNVGDVTPGPVTAMRFHGKAWERPDALAAKGIQGFVLHEAFHFWNGGLASHAPDTPTWLHEGGAEYASLLAGREEGVLTEADVRERLSQAMQRCRQGLELSGNKPLAEMGFLSNQVRYPCGTVLQWAADLHIRRGSDGRRNVLDAWSEVIRTARDRPDRTYRLADFYAAADIATGADLAPIALLVHQGGGERWRMLPAALEALGAEIALRPSQFRRRFTLLFHLLGENCRNIAEGQGYGFYTDERTVKLDSPEGCGILTGDPVLRSIEGGDPFEMSPETYAKVGRRCEAKADIALVTADGRTLSSPCAKPLPPEPQDYEVVRWSPAH